MPSPRHKDQAKNKVTARVTRPQPQSQAQLGKNRPAIWRIYEVHRMIRSGTYPNCSTLARVIEVTPKTIQRDISFMRHQLDLPLEYDSVQHGFYYSRDIHEFPLLQLGRHELVALFVAAQALEPFRGTELEGPLAESFRRIAEACPGEVSMQWRDLEAAFTVKAAGTLAANATLFGDLLDAVQQRYEVRFEYLKLTASQSEPRQVRPYHLAQIERAWYLIGYDLMRKDLRHFALQRIGQLRILPVHFKEPKDFQARDYLGGGFGVWNESGSNRQRHEVRIEFSDYAARVVAERQWHGTQEIRRLDDRGTRIEFSAKVARLEDITRWVLSWGSKARVIGPPELRERVRREAAHMGRMYPA